MPGWIPAAAASLFGMWTSQLCLPDLYASSGSVSGFGYDLEPLCHDIGLGVDVGGSASDEDSISPGSRRAPMGT